MSVAKLFTPKLMPARKSDVCFVNPPHTPEISRFHGSADKGEAYSPLRMARSSGQKTPDHRKHHGPISSNSDHGKY